ncbi:cysteine hydrolase [Cupriavidus necator]|uniref:Cysteine hydrolase n=1 Tax=Cupriavidus necator TaxID=106590 RepID=A0A367PPQ0_CUPNE|nr:isochorismatase family cysteine hydrolase [Cupriavidus necator]QQX88702.1 cysteine hydrolase [Cupriavidus necator]RCJ09798.1 cysteine hydrolase [Cupriavidus necator]
MSQRSNYQQQSSDAFKNHDHRSVARATLRLTAALAMAVASIATATAHPHPVQPAQYTDPTDRAMPDPTMTLDLERTALVVIDPQIDFMSPKGAAWSAVGEAVTEQRLVPNLLRLFESSKKAGVVVAISPHYYYPHDHKWKFQAPVELFQHKIKIFDRPSALSLDGFRGSGADFMPEFKPYIEDGKTIVASPHKLYSPQTNDLTFQLRKQGVTKIVLAGMLANLCVESHLREFAEQGFEVAIVRDAVAGPKLPEGDGNLSALINFRYIANALWTTDEVVARLAKPTAR